MHNLLVATCFAGVRRVSLCRIHFKPSFRVQQAIEQQQQVARQTTEQDILNRVNAQRDAALQRYGPQGGMQYPQQGGQFGAAPYGGAPAGFPPQGGSQYPQQAQQPQWYGQGYNAPQYPSY